MNIEKIKLTFFQPLYFKAKRNFYKFRANRYKSYDTIILFILNQLGDENVIKMLNWKITKKSNLLHLFVILLFMKIKKIHDNTKILRHHEFKNSKSRYLHYCIGDWLLKHRDYSDVTEHHFIKAHTKNKEININFRYSDFISQRYGFRSKKMKLIAARLMSENIFINLNKGQKLRLSIIQYQLKRDSAANRIIKSINKSFFSNYMTSPYICSKMISQKIRTDPHTSRGSQHYHAMLKYRKTFIKNILDSHGDFCLVGNAPTELNTSNGKIIDSKKIVIRINNYSLEYPEDYGIKEDIWVRVANNEVNDLNTKKNRMIIYAGNNFSIKRRNASKFFLKPYLLEKEYTVIPSHIYITLINKLGALPSTGLVIAYWIYTLTGKIPRENLFGFSHFSHIRNYKEHYFEDKNERGIHLHEWDKEMIIFADITK